MSETTESWGRPTRTITARDRLVPAWEHLPPLLLLMAGGWWVLETRNDSVWGFLGLAMVVWGMLTHGLFLAIIYGAGIIGWLFRPQWFTAHNERRHLARIRLRVQRDLEMGETARALDRLHGLRATYPGNRDLRRQLAALLMAEDRLAEAGRLLAFDDRAMPGHAAAQAAFAEAHGHDPFQMLRHAMKGTDLSALDATEADHLANLLARITRPADQSAWQTRAARRILARRHRGHLREVREDRPAALIEPAVVALLLLLVTTFG